MIKFFLFLGVLSILGIFFSPIYSVSSESFSKYHSIVNFSDSKHIIITKELALKNNYDKSILPGQIEFRIGKGIGDTVVGANMEDVRVYDKDGDNMSFTIREYEEYSSLIVDVYYPLLPNFEYEFTLQYTLDFRSSGLFFKSLQVPLKESSIPIEDGTFEIYLPKYTYFTYLGELDEYATVKGNYGIWELGGDLPNSIEFEYSFIPIRSSIMRGSYVFWISVNVLVFLFLMFEIRKEVVRVKEKE